MESNPFKKPNKSMDRSQRLPKNYKTINSFDSDKVKIAIDSDSDSILD